MDKVRDPYVHTDTIADADENAKRYTDDMKGISKAVLCIHKESLK